MKYIGKKVKYTNYDEETVNQEIDWRIFGLDENKNIILKANDCVSLKYKKSLVPAMYITITGTNSYCIKGANGKIPFMNYMTNVNNWSEFAVEGKTEAKAAMTIKEFVDSYNSVNEEDLEIEELVSGSLTTKDGTFTGKAPGWVVKKATSDEWNYNIEGINITTNVGEVPEMNFCIADYDNYIAATWLASDSAYATSCLMAVGGTNRSYRI